MQVVTKVLNIWATANENQEKMEHIEVIISSSLQNQIGIQGLGGKK